MDKYDENKATSEMDLYSRQIGAVGIDTMRKLINLNVLIVGLKGAGVEAAKNLILAGPRSVTIFDSKPVVIADLGTNFCLKEQDLGLRSVSVVRCSFKLCVGEMLLA